MGKLIWFEILFALHLNAASNEPALFDLGRRWLNTAIVSGSGSGGPTVSADSAGYFYVAGHFKDSARFGPNLFTSRHASDAYLAKYDPERNFIWVVRVENAGAFASAVHGTQAVFIAGSVQGDTLFGNIPFKCLRGTDAFLAKFDAAGNLLWVKQVGGPDVDRAMGVTVDTAGNSYITGGFGREAAFDEVNLKAKGYRDLFIAKYDPNGKLLWAKRDGGIFPQARGLAVDAKANVYIMGSFNKSAHFGTETLSSMDGYDMFLVKYDTDGKFLWARAPGGAPERFGSKLAIDRQGNPHVVGIFKSTFEFGPRPSRSSSPNIILTFLQPSTTPRAPFSGCDSFGEATLISAILML